MLHESQHEVIPRPIKETVLDAIECDLCHKKFESASQEFGCVRWDGTYSIGDETQIQWTNRERRQIYTGYGGYDTEDITQIVTYHICRTCFENRLMPWLWSQGASPTLEERDW